MPEMTGSQRVAVGSGNIPASGAMLGDDAKVGADEETAAIGDDAAVLVVETVIGADGGGAPSSPQATIRIEVMTNHPLRRLDCMIPGAFTDSNYTLESSSSLRGLQ